MELLCVCRETLSSVCRLQPGESSNCSREGRVLKCSFCGWWHSWPDPCLSWGPCTSIAGEFGNSLFFRFQVKCRFPSPLWLYNPKSRIWSWFFCRGCFMLLEPRFLAVRQRRILRNPCLMSLRWKGWSVVAGDHGVPCQLSQTWSVTVQRALGLEEQDFVSYAEEKQERVEPWI